jgi:PhnB protein
MSPQPIPSGYHSVQPYLVFQNTRAAIDFYISALGATERVCMTAPDGRVGHAEIQIGDSVLMMADEAPAQEAWSIQHFNGSPVSFLIYTEDCDAAYRRALDAGGLSIREPADQPHGDRMAGIQDPYGYRWYLATHIRDASGKNL